MLYRYYPLEKTVLSYQTFACHKMIRSQDSDFMNNHGIAATTHSIPEDQKEFLLKKKLIGEAKEVTSAPSHAKSLSELIDVQEALWALLKEWELSPEGFQKMCQEKRDLRGTYSEGVLLTRIRLAIDSPHYAHYASHPEKFTPVADNA